MSSRSCFHAGHAGFEVLSLISRLTKESSKTLGLLSGVISLLILRVDNEKRQI